MGALKGAWNTFNMEGKILLAIKEDKIDRGRIGHQNSYLIKLCR